MNFGEKFTLDKGGDGVGQNKKRTVTCRAMTSERKAKEKGIHKEDQLRSNQEEKTNEEKVVSQNLSENSSKKENGLIV